MPHDEEFMKTSLYKRKLLFIKEYFSLEIDY